MELKDKIKKLVNAYGVSGQEGMEVSAIAKELISQYTDKVEIDSFGNVTGFVSCGVEGAKTLMLDAHIDQIGLLVTEVTDDGFLRFMGIGVDQRMLLGSELTVMTRDGKKILGIVSAIPPHLQSAGDSSKSVPISEMVIDIGMTGKQAKKTVHVGDYIAFANDAIELMGDTLCGKSMDDRACLCCILHTLELLKDRKYKLNLIISASTKEEVGGHGAETIAYNCQPDFGIAIDVCHAKTPDAVPADDTSEFGGGPLISIGSNSNPKLARKMIALAKAKDIPFQPNAMPAHSGTNAWSMQMVHHGIPTLVMSLPLKYMHSPVEMLRMSDVKNVGKLIAEFVCAFDGEEVRI